MPVEKHRAHRCLFISGVRCPAGILDMFFPAEYTMIIGNVCCVVPSPFIKGGDNMKRISVFVCMLLMLSLLCLVGVASAETEGECQHYAYCTAPTVCAECGYEGEIEDILHDTDDAVLIITPTEHQYQCPKCGEIGLSSAHFTFCTSPNACTICGYEGEIEEIIHLSAVHDPETHMQTCADCGAIFMDIETSFTPEEHTLTCADCDASISGPHFAGCTNPNVCVVCGYEGKIANLGHENAVHDPDTHVQTCTECDAVFTEFTIQSVVEATCTTDGLQIDVCDYCAQEVRTILPALEHNDIDFIITPDTHQAQCTLCGELEIAYAHFAFCDTPNVCTVCGYEGEIAELVHENTDHNPNTHAQTCTECGTMFLDFEKIITPETHTFTCTWCQTAFSDSHAASCTAPTVCTDCGYEGEIEDILHNSEGADFIITPDEHQLICSSCGKLGNPQAHYAPCTSPNTCHFCGYKGEIKDILHPFAVHDPDTHVQTCILCGTAFTDFIDPVVAEATCTADGLKTASCSYCYEKLETVLPALGHDWKLTDRIAPTCMTEGYHKYTCRRCNWWTRGEVQPALSTAECTMLRAEIGDVVCTVCPVCASTTLTPETKAAVALVENAAAEGTDAQVIVREAVPEAKLSVKRIFCVRLVKDSTDVQPGSAIRLRIPCADAQGLTLMHLSESGELTEIACVLTGGTLVFETDKVGVFLLVEAR